MTQHDTAVVLRQMLAAARRVAAITRDRTREQLDSDELLDLAVVRLLEILGEAANRVPRSEQALHPAIRWAELISLRNRLIHGYDTVDLDIVWTIVKDDIPEVIRELERIAEDDGETDTDR